MLCVMEFDLKAKTGLPERKVRVNLEEGFLLEEEGMIVCKACGNRITTIESIITVDGSHRHVFTNPEGLTFEIGCFSSAEGCLVSGIPTLQYTWFAGFSWNYAHCSACLVHLGWFYQKIDKSFFGLILDRIVESTKTH